MLMIFFIIVFIAEIIITVQIINLIMKADRCILSVNEKVLSFQPELKKNVETVGIFVKKFANVVRTTELFYEKQKNRYKNLLIKNILTLIIFLMLNKNGKHAITIVDIILSVSNLLSDLKN